MNGQHLACEVLTRMCVILTRRGLLFLHKMIQEIISMLRADSGCPHNFMVDSWVFKDDDSESEAKTNSGHRIMSALGPKSTLRMCRTRTMSAIGALCKCTHTHTLHARAQCTSQLYYRVDSIFSNLVG